MTFQAAIADSSQPKIGIVVMHGKGGEPSRLVGDLAASLANKGYVVANIEMPWSGQRHYDVSVTAAEKEVVSALDGLRSRGAKKLYVAGHSQGGVFALYFGTRHEVDGIVAIAPGGDVASDLFRDKLRKPVKQARKLVEEGKGGEEAKFFDFEGSRGAFPVVSTAANYLSWFDPKGAMNQKIAVKNMKPSVPVFYIVPKRDIPALLKVKNAMFRALPRHPRTRLHEPDSGHKDAPSASLEGIVNWTRESSN
jgi:pimeloyl-ACP methyl ester carboxylesterase